MRTFVIATLAVLLSLVTSSCWGDSGDSAATSSPESGKPLPPALDNWFPPPDAGAVGPSQGWLEESCSLPRGYLRSIRRGYYPGRSPDVMFVPRVPNYIGTFIYTTHGGPWPYLQRVPLIMYAPGRVKAAGKIKIDRAPTLADIAPTTAALLGEGMPERDGRVLSEALTGVAENPPRLVVTVVIDGGGEDVLRAWPNSWPYLKDIASAGAWLRGAEVGSAPSVTPASHTTVGTGAWPSHHGIVDLTQRGPGGVTDSFGARNGPFDPRNLEMETLGDLYDRLHSNEPKVGLVGYRGWHLGLMGHGAAVPGGDKDVAAIFNDETGRLITGERYYSLPPYLTHVPGLEQDLRAVDTADGKADSLWRGRVSLEDRQLAQYTPAWTRYQNRIIESLITGEGFGLDGTPDLLFINYKQIDDVGHFYDLLSPFMKEAVAETDRALGDLRNFVDERVGPRNWALIVTADHGVAPRGDATGGWPIDLPTLETDIANHFDVDAGDLFVQERTMGFWFDKAFMKSEGITMTAIADFISSYTLSASVPEESTVSERYAPRSDELVFAGAFPGRRLDDVWRCAKRRAG